MRLGSNRRLANVKTRTETGLEYIFLNLNLQTPFGKKELKEIKPFFPGEEEELRAELDKVENMMNFAGENSLITENILEVFMEIKDASLTLKRSANNALSVVELYEIKGLLLQMRQLIRLTRDKEIGDYKGCHCVSECAKDKDDISALANASAENKGASVPEEYILEDTEDLLDELDPRGDRLSTFYIYDEFSEKLGRLRGRKRELEVAIRKEQKAGRETLRKEYGIMLTPKFDIVVSRSHQDFDKIANIPELERVSEDYVSVTYQLKPNDEVFRLMKETEDLNAEIDEEEEIIRKELSEKIYQSSDRIERNCKKIGELDLALAKALFAIKRNLVKPVISDEHIVEITEGRNIQVEDILRGKGKEYHPVSISLKDGVTLITGANMGGKTISLKLSGQVPILAQYGFFVGAKEATVGLSNYIQILIGDSQSVERGLSSFGSEMEELKEILDHGVDKSLILVDEIASGTNPTEGTALTKSLVDYLLTKPYISLITTHFETAFDQNGVVNLQVNGLKNADFMLLNREIQYANRRERINIISKYMDYRLSRVEKDSSVPKDALNIAKMLGISQEIIDGAKKYIK